MLCALAEFCPFPIIISCVQKSFLRYPSFRVDVPFLVPEYLAAANAVLFSVLSRLFPYACGLLWRDKLLLVVANKNLGFLNGRVRVKCL